MKAALLTLALMTFTATAPAMTLVEGEAYHVMWKNAKGKPKCCNKKSKEKAEICAKKMRDKGKATDVQVMAGKCKDM